MSITIPKFKNINNILLIFSGVIIVSLFLFAILRDNARLITLNEAKELLASKSIQKVVTTKSFTYLKSAKQSYKIPTSQVRPELLKNQRVEIEKNSNVALTVILLLFFLALITFIIKFFRDRESYRFAYKKEICKDESKNTESNHTISAIKSDVSFSDIGGIEEVKSELEEIIDFLKNPLRYKKFGARLPKGVLLVGPPGVGKTMIAKAVAAEADVPFFYQSGASFVQIYVGMGAKRVHELFEAAQKNQPSIIFIDEIDAIGKKRDGQKNDEREATLNQLLTEMDGFTNSSGIIVIAATNKIDVLDEALLRAGRFDRRVHVELPTQHERALILEKYLQKIPHDVEVGKVVKMTLGFNGASLATLVNEAALLAIKADDAKVTIEHFNAVKNKVQFGKKRVILLSESQKRCRAIYQSAKALYATWNNLDFDKILLTNDTFSLPLSEPMLKSELLTHVKLHLSGIAFCQIKLGEHDSYAKRDIEIAKKLLHLMLNDYAMGDNLIITQDKSAEFFEKLLNEVKEFLFSKESILHKFTEIFVSEESLSKERCKEIISEFVS